MNENALTEWHHNPSLVGLSYYGSPTLFYDFSVEFAWWNGDSGNTQKQGRHGGAAL